ncbi:dienelactone hydrolase family protein [Ktedonospora formicarum]|uniref:Dienelactone hydrolase domain-containing protein n=1 Tax=Ktedonospora formicarum TaxID=2778364 RepID=A0A8J3MQX4_9CHLR|nr:dienelactone hydrolase family protein [Ktedonospora formicarum]GHO43226.1 hypothetical protein KSX_13890 [Ktedonospora formicarum]
MAVIRTSQVKLPVNGDNAYAFVAQPDDDATHPGLVLIQEWWGIEPHIQDLAKKLAVEGFVVAVPDLFHGKVATEPNDAMRLMMMAQKNIDRAVKEIIGALNVIKNMDIVEPKKLGLVGFCFGGFLAYTTASHYPDLGALSAFYGAGYDPTPEEIARVNAPVLAIYGSQDNSIPLEQVHTIEKRYQDAGKDITVKIYDAGHAFINPDHGAGNEAAAADAWPRLINFLKEKLR